MIAIWYVLSGAMLGTAIAKTSVAEPVWCILFIAALVSAGIGTNIEWEAKKKL